MERPLRHPVAVGARLVVSGSPYDEMVYSSQGAPASTAVPVALRECPWPPEAGPLKTDEQRRGRNRSQPLSSTRYPRQTALDSRHSGVHGCCSQRTSARDGPRRGLPIGRSPARVRVGPALLPRSPRGPDVPRGVDRHALRDPSEHSVVDHGPPRAGEPGGERHSSGGRRSSIPELQYSAS